MKLVMLITAQKEKGLDVALAWQEAGAPGVTILRAHGLNNLQKTIQHGAVELPRMVSSVAAALAHIIDSVEQNGEILLSVVEADMVDKLLEVANSVLGDLTLPNNGILLVIDIERAIGVRDHSKP
jgi:hypothetical protein